jgi:hypothetical protein
MTVLLKNDESVHANVSVALNQNIPLNLLGMDVLNKRCGHSLLRSLCKTLQAFPPLNQP